MLTVTEAATAHLADILDNSEATDDAAVRLVASEQGLSLVTDDPKPEDTSFEHAGKTVLVLDQQVADALDGRTLDIGETEDGGKGLAIS